MVLYFTCIDPSYVIFMGKDKFENEHLIKHGWVEDVWFHVDNLSSAHVYLRLKKFESLDDIPAAVLEDCCQIVKANSIQGCKLQSVDVVYTSWTNLKKTGAMDVGQVGFLKEKAVKKVRVAKNGAIVNRLTKTKVERNIDLAAEKESRDQAERVQKKQQLKEDEKKKREDEERQKEERDLKSYRSIMDEQKMKTNNVAVDDITAFEDDFFS